MTSQYSNKVIFQNLKNDNMTMNDIINYIFEILNFSDKEIILNAIELTSKIQSEKTDYYEKLLNSAQCVIYSVFLNNKLFSQIQLYDLLTILSQLLDDQQKLRSNTIIFNIYKDIMENYSTFDNTLKAIFPTIILDVLSIIHRGNNLTGNKVNFYSIDTYYKNSKSKIESYTKFIHSFSKREVKESIIDVTSDEDLINTLHKITGRPKDQLNKSFTKIVEPDLSKMQGLCSNYGKLEKYTSLVGTIEFKNKIENDIGKKLSESQMQHISNSIKKIKLYVENILDGTFMPSGKHGINHIKHNLEYGYQLLGFIQSKRRKTINKT
ncbi:MAG: hypothetical protein DA328_09510 [Nitrososphaeraceae archaeon]|nr:hypothetical protein [Nitrososphaeraceae archaeon]